VPEKISQQALNRMAVRGAKIKRKSSPVPTPEEVRAAEPPPPPPAPDNSIPMASMAASMNIINQQLGDIVAQNSRVIEQFRTEAAQKVQERPGRQPWRAIVNRDKNKLIHYVDLIPLKTEGSRS
jgi:hypothetical protein